MMKNRTVLFAFKILTLSEISCYLNILTVATTSLTRHGIKHENIASKCQWETMQLTK